MKKYIVMLLLLASFCMGQTIHSKPNADWWSGDLSKDIAWKWAKGIEGTVNGRNPGTTFYVDGNKLTAGNGSTWETAFNTLSAAMAASHADIAVKADRQWASRNTIYVMGDEITEDLVILAQKTDIIGVGSNDGYGKAGITGTWIIPDTVDYMGCHFYNMMFTDPGATAIFDLDTQGGIEFHNCLFDMGAASTIAVQAEESSWLVINGCEFSAVSATLPWTTVAIVIVQDTNPIYGCKITNNLIMGGAIGIDWNETESYNCWITDNYIRATGLTIDEEGDNVFVVNNRLITDVDTTTSTAGYDFNIQLAAGNIQMGVTGLGDTIPFTKIAE